MDPRITSAIGQYRRNLEKHGIHIVHLILYGSYAHGTAHQESDIDLLVVSNDFKPMDTWDRLCFLGKARGGIYMPMEIQGATVDEYENAAPGSFLQDEIRSKGIAV